jgi:hypothetical protein
LGASEFASKWNNGMVERWNIGFQKDINHSNWGEAPKFVIGEFIEISAVFPAKAGIQKIQYRLELFLDLFPFNIRCWMFDVHLSKQSCTA